MMAPVAIPSCGMNDTKLEVRENGVVEEELSDVDDDVFIRGRNSNQGFRLEIYDTAKKPLMAPRKKRKDFDNLTNGGFHTEIRSSPPSLRFLCMPICYILVATFAMLGVIALIAVVSHYVTLPLSLLKFWNVQSSSRARPGGGILPCDTFKVEDVWIRKFPKLFTHSALRLLDVNGDSIDDIIFGYSTGADGYDIPDIVCDIYFSGQKPCFGGVIALNGRDASELWRYWTDHEVFALNCNEDISGDGIRDCLMGGRGGVFGALNGASGTLLWGFTKSPPKKPLFSIYTPQFIRDVNDDLVPDILAVHGGDPMAYTGNKIGSGSRVMILSGKNGDVLQWMETPDGAESSYSPQILTGRDGLDSVIIGTGSQTHGGSLYVIPLTDIVGGHIKNARKLYENKRKGIIVTPVLTDITGDGLEDIILPHFNSTVIAWDGSNFNQIWNYSFPASQTYMTPTPGYFNEDNIPDFLVKYQIGFSGLPILYNAKTTILDGQTGKPFLKEPFIDTIGSQSSTPLIRVQGYGNDIFLLWTSNCIGINSGNDTMSQFTFKPGTSPSDEESNANLCKLRFGSQLINQLRAFNRNTGLPGALIYDSQSRRDSEYSGAVNTSLEGQKYVELHPQLQDQWRRQEQEGNDEDSQLQNPSGMVDIGQQPEDTEEEDSEDHGHLYVPKPQSPRPQQQHQRHDYQNEYGERKYSSDAEVIANLPYPSRHMVRKHGDDPQSLHPFDTQPDIGVVNIPWPNYDNVGQDNFQQPHHQWNTRRTRRHLRSHTDDEIQRLISLGTLAKPLWKDDGIDFVFGTYWFYPSSTSRTQVVSNRAKKCIEEKMMLEGRRFEETSPFYGLNHDQYEDTITQNCLQTEDGINPRNDPVYDSQSSFDPFNLRMGQMSIYRLHISCSCSEANANQRCGKILPFEEQPWTGHMGSRADSHFN